MRIRTARRSVVPLIIAAAALIALSGSAQAMIGDPAQPHWITSDKEDYAPGELVTLTGGNWQPGEVVHIRVNDDLGETWRRDVDVLAGEDGRVSDGFALPDWFVAIYTVTATGSVSGTATTTFTDGTVAARNATTTPAALVANYKLERFSNTGCTGSATQTRTFSRTGGSNTGGGSSSIASGNAESVKVSLVSSSGSTASFSQWNFVNGNTSGDGAFYSTSPSVCFETETNTNRTFIAVFNAAPTVNRDSTSVTVAEGQTAANTGTFSDTDSGDDVTITASVGSVSTTGTSTGTWSWSFAAIDGPAESQTVTITADDGTSTTATTFALVVTNANPAAAFPASRTVDEGGSSTFSFSGQSDPSAADTAAGLHYAYSCTGASLAASVYATAGTTASVSCAFGNDGAQTLRARIIDKDGGFREYTTVVTVQNLAPVIDSVSADSPIGEGTSSTVTVTAHDAFDTPLGYEFDCDNDGSYEAGPQAGNSHSCMFDDNGSATVKVRVSDDDTATTGTGSVTVQNSAPTATFPASVVVLEGDSQPLSFSGPSDPSQADTDAGFHYAFDCHGGSLAGATYAGSGTADSVTCSYADGPDGDTVRARIIDKDGGFGEYTADVTVQNVVPEVTAPADQERFEGDAFTHFDLGSFTDPGADSNWDVSVDWGDGGTTTFSEPSTGAISSQGHSYDDNGVYPVTVTVSEDDGAGDSGSATFQVTVRNASPVVHASPNDTATEGTANAFSLGEFSDPGPNDDPWQVTVDWGDGETTGPFATSSQGSLGSLSHTYADNATYTVTVMVEDKDGGSGSDTLDVVVTNADPVVTPGPNDTAGEGTVKSFALGSFGDLGVHDDPWDVTVHWGDDSADGTFTTSSQGALGSLPHTFPDNGTYTVVITVRDKDGGSGAQSFQVTVANLSPSGDLGNDGPVAEGSPATIRFTNADDPSPVDRTSLRYLFDCTGGDLSGFGYAEAGAAGETACTYPDGPSNHTVTGAILDKDGGRFDTTTVVRVDNVAPNVTAAPDQSSDEGENHSFDLGSFTDPGPDSPWKVRVDWGDGTVVDLADAIGPPPVTLSGEGMPSHTYVDNGSYTVEVQVTDKDGDTGTGTFTVEVANSKPSVTAAADQTSDEGTAESFSLGSFGDAGIDDDPWSVDVDWGDGSAHTTFASSTQGSLGTRSHTYLDGVPTAYTVTVRVTDKDGGHRSASFQVTVANVAPHITSFAGTNSLAGPLVFVSSTFTAAFTDPGADSPWTTLFGWQDGATTPDSVWPATPGSPFSLLHRFGSPGCSKWASLRVTDKDGAHDTATTTVSVGGGEFLPPITNTPVTNKLKNGQVLPVKVRITACNGTPVAGLNPQIQLKKGDLTAIGDDLSTAITPDSVSAADTTGTMRSADGFYIYNMRVNVAAADIGKDLTIIIYPYGNTGAGAAQTIRHVIVATK